MADRNPFDAFDAPQANPFDAFDGPPKTPGPTDAIAQPDTLPGLDPRTATLGDYLMKLHQAVGGLGQIGGAAQDYGRVAANTFGVGDRFLARADTNGGVLATLFPGLAGNVGSPSIGNLVKQQIAGGGDNYAANLAAERAKTAAATERLGPAGSIAANLTGYGPFAALGIAGKGGVLRTALEGGAAGAAAGWGHGDGLADAAEGGAAGAVGGAGVGALTKYLVNPLATLGANWFGKMTGALSDPTAVTDALEANKNLAYLPTHSIGFDGLPIDQAYRTAVNTLGKDQVAGLSGGFKSAVQDHLEQNANGVPTSASEIDGFMRGLDEAAGTNADRTLAGRIKENLQEVLDTTPPLTGQAPGVAADLIAKAKTAHQLYSNASDLQEWSQSLKGFGSSPAGQAQKLAETYYPDPNSDEYKALSNIAQAAGGSGQSAYNLMHMIDPLLGYVGASVGGGPGAMAGEIAGHLMKPGLASALTAVQQRGTQRAIGGAYPALTKNPPTLWSPDLGQAVRALLLGKAASAGF
jgi:hypothetical protein